ncbi:MAG: acyl carrier protein [Lachnospiraceae bacterium]|nr:acyl carrier protein [Lachnospiraceae bacterium]
MTVDILEKFKEYIKEYTDEEISEEVKIESLGIDSVDFVQFLIELEDYTGIEFEEDYLIGEELTVGDYIVYIKEQIEINEKGN